MSAWLSGKDLPKVSGNFRPRAFLWGAQGLSLVFVWFSLVVWGFSQENGHSSDVQGTTAGLSLARDQ